MADDDHSGWERALNDDGFSCSVCGDRPARSCEECESILCYQHYGEAAKAFHEAGCLQRLA